MGLLSFLQRKAAAGAGSDPLSVDAARLRARRRLIGAVVLVALGVVGFPLLFDTSPRPVPLDIPIEIAEQQAASEPASAKPVPEAVAAPPAVTQEELIADRAADTERETAASPAPAVNPAPAAPDRTAEKRPEAAAEAAPPRKAAAATAPAKAKEEAARALAALQGKSASGKPAEAPEATGRFVVQVGAFSEPASARQARQRVEKLGLKSYTQVVKTSAGERIRVRVGPYGDRSEADRAAARLKQAGLQPAVLTL